MLKILIVDDEKLARMRLRAHLKLCEVKEADSYSTALESLKEHFDICFIDLNLDDQSTELFGLEVLKATVQKGIYSVVMSSVKEEEVIEHAYQIGCREFYNKGKEELSVAEIIQKFLFKQKDYIASYFFKEVFPTKSNKQKQLISMLLPFLETEIPICVLGETGTGKSYLASQIHKQSKRSGQFIEVNCGAMSEELLEAELFGHSKGAYSGAVQEQKGKLLLANGGTLFLDEIGNMSEKMQAKLLKAIEEKSFYPVNSDKIVHSNFRLITATLENLEQKIKNGTFRFDLYQRICGFTIELLPLRERSEDILDLLKKEMDLKNLSNRKVILSKEAKYYLENYSWPGNIRQLKRTAEMLLTIRSGMITEQDLAGLLTEKSENKFITQAMINTSKEMGLQHLIDLIEKEIIQASLEENNQSIRKTMSMLKISQSKVYKYKDEHDKK